ncbi:MAG TPA: exonuclease SbcCD subunit D, partial [Clostridia bacterium]|nr:exonuclease SbcCD subunit D [Clostridia bacterium]
MVFSFIHMADVHFDTPFASKDPAFRRFMRESTRAAFRAGVDLALRKKVNAFLIAGDLFDNNTLSFATERFLVEQLNRLKDADINVYYSPGNHDPWGSNFRLSQISWPANVHIFRTSEPETVPVVGEDGNTLALITGAGHEGNREGRNLAAAFPECSPKGVPHIGLLHTMVTGTSEGEHERYAPSTLPDLVQKGYTYWALGHVHVRSILSQNPMIVYSGNLMGRNSRETGAKGAYLVEVDTTGQPRINFHTLAPVCWHDLTVGNLDEIRDLEGLEREIFNIVTGYLDERAQYGDPLLKINLSGPTPLFAELDNEDDRQTLTDLLKESLNLRFLEISVKGLVRQVDPAEYREGPHVLSEVLSLLDTLKAGTPNKKASGAAAAQAGASVESRAGES